jgi:hypothetical protein
MTPSSFLWKKSSSVCSRTKIWKLLFKSKIKEFLLLDELQYIFENENVFEKQFYFAGQKEFFLFGRILRKFNHRVIKMK